MPRAVTQPRLLTSFLRPFPDFIIIGAMKCGTTTLHHQLREHPLVRAPIRKEIHFFDREWAQGPAWYRAHFPSALGGRTWKTGEASPYYVCHPHVPARIAELLPDVKLIVMLRNPVTRAYSHYRQIHAKGWDPLSFEEALEAEADRIGPELARMEAEPDYFSETHRRFSYLQRGRYAEQLERWLRFFRREQLKIIATEELRAEPSRVHAELQQFLGLSPHPMAGARDHKVAQYEPMSAQTRERLSDYFAPYNQQLYELIGRDLGWERAATGPRTEVGSSKRRSGLG
jgi:hypothetical protein